MSRDERQGTITSLWSRTSLADARLQAGDTDEVPQLRRSLGISSLVLIGIGNAIGAGIFVLTGTAAANYAGPAIAISYLIAGLVCLLTSLCYAEVSALLPSAGGSYAYARVALGRFPAWLIGWCMIIEYLIAGSTVAVGWSAYAQRLLEQCGVALPTSFQHSPFTVGLDNAIEVSGSLFDLPAVAMVLFCSAVLFGGVRGLARINGWMVSVKIGVILLVVIVGAAFVNTDNWLPFIPPEDGAGRFGISGVLTASAIAFFSYSGFEAMSTSAREVRDPGRSLPRALLFALGICMVLYVGMALIMTGIASYTLLNTASPIVTALSVVDADLNWLITVVNVGTVIGLGAAVLISLYGQSRVFYAMARDGEMPSFFADVSAKYGTPGKGTLCTGALAAIIAGLFPISLLGELVSMGCLIAFASVCLSTLVLRRIAPSEFRPFRLPLSPLIPVLGLSSCLGLMFSLPAVTWYYIGAWVAVGVVLYLVSNVISIRRRSVAGNNCNKAIFK